MLIKKARDARAITARMLTVPHYLCVWGGGHFQQLVPCTSVSWVDLYYPGTDLCRAEKVRASFKLHGHHRKKLRFSRCPRGLM